MASRSVLSSFVPRSLREILRGRRSGPSRARRDSNDWLRVHCRDVGGRILSIGSGADSDGQGDSYRNYCANASSYTTSEVDDTFGADLVLDVRSMPELEDDSFDGVFCSGVLEHVDDFKSALAEITRVLKKNGILLLGLPFRQAIHMPPHDYWRFTDYGIRYLLADSYDVLSLVPIDADDPDFPASYWTKARKR